ncbi:MAG TPA: hypothetical protein PL106_16070, partial [Flavobacteriales bacterium]|nr:hypothetical protein [Flavobacteriales bacterium]
VQDTGLEDLCHVHDDPGRMRLSIQACMAQHADGALVEKRMAVLEQRFCNRKNAAAILKAMF